MAKKSEQYFEGVGRRKTAVARVRIFENSKDNSFVINDKFKPEEYFDTEKMVQDIYAPMEATGTKKSFMVTVHVRGGGKNGKVEAIQLGLSRALVRFDGELQRILRDLDYLKRDPRRKERKKPGLKKARRSPQWSKR